EMSLAPPGGTGVEAMTPVMGAACRPVAESSPPSTATKRIRAGTCIVVFLDCADLDRSIFGQVADARLHDLHWEYLSSAFEKPFRESRPESEDRRPERGGSSLLTPDP